MAFLMAMIKGIMGLILLTAYLIIGIGTLWVLRIAIDWFWDFDYVDYLKGKERR